MKKCRKSAIFCPISDGNDVRNGIIAVNTKMRYNAGNYKKQEEFNERKQRKQF